MLCRNSISTDALYYRNWKATYVLANQNAKSAQTSLSFKNLLPSPCTGNLQRDPSLAPTQVSIPKYGASSGRNSCNGCNNFTSLCPIRQAHPQEISMPCILTKFAYDNRTLVYVLLVIAVWSSYNYSNWLETRLASPSLLLFLIVIMLYYDQMLSMFRTCSDVVQYCRTHSI